VLSFPVSSYYCNFVSHFLFSYFCHIDNTIKIWKIKIVAVNGQFILKNWGLAAPALFHLFFLQHYLGLRILLSGNIHFHSGYK